MWQNDAESKLGSPIRALVCKDPSLFDSV
jgi:hypothetical protein